jgi:diguanylate cyclase (GGDEF)-like protein
MDLNCIPLSAAGSLSVSLVAIFFFASQCLLSIRKKRFTYNVWAAILSFSTAGFAFFMFLQYVAPPSEVQHLIDKCQFSFLVVMLHSLVGFSFAYLEIPSLLYHRIGGLFHLAIIITLWASDLIVSRTLVSRHLLWVSRPYVESDLGPLGALFMLYLIATSVFLFVLWLKHRTRNYRMNLVVAFGIFIYIVLGIHDALASNGVFTPAQFLLEYGFLAFSTVILYVTAREFINVENQAFALQRLNEELGIIARTDSLTKLANRYGFDRQYEKEWKVLKRQMRKKTITGCLSLILCDIDFFKEYNDTYGHKEGDNCLILVATVLAECARRPADFVSRYGGDEFAVLLPDTPQSGSIIVAELMLRKMRERRLENKSSSVKPYVTLSLGIASALAEEDLSQDELFVRADRALYEAKKNGRDRFEVDEQIE